MNKTYSRNLWLNLVIAVAGVIYVLIMFKLLLVRPRYFGGVYSYNITPFETIMAYIADFKKYKSNISFRNLFGNIILFIPIGVIFPLLYKPLLRFIPFAAFTIGLIFSVEMAQMLLKVGSFDVDDIILNTFGAVIGLIMTRLLLAVIRKRSNYSTAGKENAV